MISRQSRLTYTRRTRPWLMANIWPSHRADRPPPHTECGMLTRRVTCGVHGRIAPSSEACRASGRASRLGPRYSSKVCPRTFRQGPSKRFEGPCPFPSHLSPHGRHTTAAPTDPLVDPRCRVICQVTPRRLGYRSSEVASSSRDHGRVTDAYSWGRLSWHAPRGASMSMLRSGLPTRVGNSDGDPSRFAGATMPGEFTLVIKARRKVWAL
jgi:hypothetical protein